MEFKIVEGSKFQQISKALINTNGQCPCVPKYAWNEDTKCTCKNFREQATEGECHCGMYRKVKTNE